MSKSSKNLIVRLSNLNSARTSKLHETEVYNLNETSESVINDFYSITDLKLNRLYDTMSKENTEDSLLHLLYRLPLLEHNKFRNIADKSLQNTESRDLLINFTVLIKSKDIDTLKKQDPIKQIFRGNICAVPKGEVQERQAIQKIQARLIVCLAQTTRKLDQQRQDLKQLTTKFFMSTFCKLVDKRLNINQPEQIADLYELLERKIVEYYNVMCEWGTEEVFFYFMYCLPIFEYERFKSLVSEYLKECGVDNFFINFSSLLKCHGIIRNKELINKCLKGLSSAEEQEKEVLLGIQATIIEKLLTTVRKLDKNDTYLVELSKKSVIRSFYKVANNQLHLQQPQEILDNFCSAIERKMAHIFYTLSQETDGYASTLLQIANQLSTIGQKELEKIFNDQIANNPVESIYNGFEFLKEIHAIFKPANQEELLKTEPIIDIISYVIEGSSEERILVEEVQESIKKCFMKTLNKLDKYSVFFNELNNRLKLWTTLSVVENLGH